MHAVVTGANRGIGAQLVSEFTSHGWDVTGTARGGQAGLAPLDVTDTDSLAAFAASLDGKPLNLLVCNAGVYFDKGAPLETGFPAQMWADTFAVNVTGVFLTVQSLLPHLRATKGAKIAIISSMMASHTRAPGGSYIYRASKAAALNIGRNLASDLKADGIAVGIYHPGWVPTDMGGPEANIPADASAKGLTREFQALSMETTGCFRTWDGEDHAY
ncbi:SDR family NAD(P)-dependent oxidoreductase [Primorskyibacter sp. S187A]|uniref:SDR family NAD(P)-dependent oxidoreductase n=1 Tax=Primorskyibacter sp. S187A TaxID=3415130 RepID=UPI003C7DE1C5